MSTVRNMPGKPASSNEPKRPAREKSDGVGWSRWVRVIVSVLILWHLFAVFISPFAVPPTSETIFRAASSDYVRWYTDPLYLNHGYHFFAPDPTPSRVIRYRVASSSGETISEGQFPNLREYWPRLLYHRYLMLADQSDTPLGLNGEEYAQRRTSYILQRFALHLLQSQGGDLATVELLEHRLLTPADLEAGRRIDDSSTFVSRMKVEQTANDLKAAEERRAQGRGLPPATANSPGGGAP